MRKIFSTLILTVLVFSLFSCTRKKDLGNVLRFALREKIRSMDPIKSSEHYSSVEVRRAYEGLLEYHYLKRPYVLEPLLAESMPEISKNGLIYNFKIRKGVFFQDDVSFPLGKGRELEAEDFVYSLKRLADPKNVSDGWWILDGSIVGLNEWRKKADYNEVIEGLYAKDRYTLVFKLTQKNSLFLHRLAMPFACVVAKEVVAHYQAEFLNHPVGTGPFVLESYAPNQLIWKRNPTYRKVTYPSEGTSEDKKLGRLEDAGKQIPFVDKLIDDLIVEDQPAWLNFLQGNHDYMMKVTKDSATTVFDNNHNPSKQIRDLGVQVFEEPGTWFSYFGFNMEDPAIGGDANRFLRKAMSLAYDEAPTIDKFYLGLAVKAESPIPPGVEGFDAKYKNPSREYNLAKAREILSKAGHEGGKGLPKLVIDISTDSTTKQISEYFQRQMSELGIVVEINSSSWPEFINRVRKKQVQIFAVSWIYDYPDAENGWQLLYSKNESPGSNESNFKNAEFDKLYSQAIALQPSELSQAKKRLDLFSKMRKIFEDEVPWIITVYPAETRLAHSWVRNFKIHPFERMTEKYLRVDGKAREIALKSGALAVGK